MGIRSARRTSLVFVAAAACVLGLNASPALAGPSHIFSTTFGAAGSTPANPYPLSGPTDTAVDNSGGPSAGDVYVTDPGNHRVEKFDSSGNFLLMFGKRVDQTTGANVCTLSSGDTCQAGAYDYSSAAFTTPTFVAVDSAGDVYVDDTADGLGRVRVRKFDSSGNPITTWGSGGQLGSIAFDGIAVDTGGNLFAAIDSGTMLQFAPNGTSPRTFGTPDGTQPHGIAVDSSDNLYKVSGFSTVEKFTNTGADIGEVDGVLDGVGLVIDPSTDDLYVDQRSGVVNHFTANCPLPDCPPADSFGAGHLNGAQGLSIDTSGNAFVANTGDNNVAVFAGANPLLTTGAALSSTPTTATVSGHLDPFGRGTLTDCHFDYGPTTAYGSSVPCSPAAPYSNPTDVSADLSGLTVETAYHYRLAGTNGNGTYAGLDRSFTPHNVVGLSTDPATNLAPTAATLNGSWTGVGDGTHYYFEWGTDTSYGHVTAVPPGDDGGSASGSTVHVHTDISGLDPVTTYHYRIVATNSAGTSIGQDQSFKSHPYAPLIVTSVSNVHAEAALLHAQINPGGGDTTYHFEWGSGDCSLPASACTSTPTPDADAGSGFNDQAVSRLLSGLAPGTTYHFRLVATNAESLPGGTASPDRTFTTSSPGTGTDPCPNAHVRQQAGASLLLDCRAYELVSAANAGGYDVESNLVAGQNPFGGYPQADSRLLYGVHNGAIPETGNPTNHGVDPYLATRGADGWSTQYVGIPANNPNASGPFSSTLAEADSTLGTFAFGGPNICSPCFSDGSTGNPIHLPDGSLVQGMAGSNAHPDATAAGEVAKSLSANGSHFVFGSTAQFESNGNSNGTDASIYDRNLTTGVTHAVSLTPGAAPIQNGDGVAELDISSNGNRIVIGKLVSTDAAGNRYYHLYMHVGGALNTIDLTPATPDGALYDGMSADGTKVYFTTKDVPTGASDGDTSADIYRADVTASAATLTRVSTGSGGTGGTDSCDPAANTVHTRWNSVGSAPNCDVVAVGGGGGVASGDGSIYFLSPELLDGSSNGVQDAPNLYIARPGSAPHYIRTLESSANAPLPPFKHSFQRSFGSFTAPTGVAVDHSSGDVYVLDVQSAVVQKFDSSGNPVSSFGDNSKLDGSNTPTGVFQEFPSFPAPIQIAVDQATGDLYVPDLFNSVVDKFDSSGNYISQISVSFPTGVAVDQANGNVYVPSFFGNTHVFDSSGNPTAPTLFATPPFFTPLSIAVDSSGNAYVTDTSKTEVYDSAGNDVKTLDSNPSYGVSVDPSDDHVYVDEGKQVVEYDPAGNTVGVPSGSGLLSGSIGLSADSGSLYVSNPGAGRVAVFAPGAIPPDPNTDNPLVIDSVSEAGARHTADFQVTPNGNDAVFASTLPLANYDNAAHREVFRYDAPTDHLDCASCNPTGEQATGEASLASNGSSLSDDGRVFFNSTEGLVDRDLNDKKDAYEWSNGKVELISTGTSPLDSSLLSVSADGTDAFFFTHDTLVPSDQNGSRVKVYDARANGGFAFAPAPVPCQASDECHGAGSPFPAPPSINTVNGTGGNDVASSTKTCKTGFVKRQGKCVRRRHHRRHHKRAHHKRGGAK